MKNERNLKWYPATNGTPAHWRTEFTFRDAAGRKRRVRRFAGLTKDAARTFISKLRVEHEKGTVDEFIGRKKIDVQTFGAYGRTVLDSAEWKSKRSAGRDEISFANLKAELGDMRLDRINPAVVRDYMTKRTERDKMSPATANRELSLLKSILYHAEYDGLIPANPIRGRRVKKLAENNNRADVLLSLDLTFDKLCSLVDVAADYLKPILTVALKTGMRQGEILKLKWTDIDWRMGFIRVRAENAKSKKERFIPMDGVLVGTFDELPRIGEYVFMNAETKTRRKDVRGGFVAACHAAKIPTGRENGIVFHDLRHFAAFRLVKTTDIVTAAEILGHADVKMTMRYCHPTKADKKAAIEKMGEIFGSRRHSDVNRENGTAENAVENRAQFN